MVKRALLPLLWIAHCTISYGQAIQSITGKVVDATGQGLFGNAIVVSPEDSSTIQGTPFFEGDFALSGLSHQQVLLKLSSLAFQDTYLTVTYEGQARVDLGNMVVDEAENELDEVMVVGQRSLVTEKADGSLEVKVANTTLATSTSVNEILSKSPGVVMNEDNEVHIFGKGAAIVFINGLKVENERLSTLSPSDIESIEIISNPGPRYDAEGNAVINIITKRHVDEGSKGLVKNYLSYSDFGGPQNRTDLNYSYSQNRWTLNSNYALLTGQHRHILETTRTRDVPEDFFQSHLLTDRHYDLENDSNYGLGAQYSVSSDHYLSLQYTGAYEKTGGEQVSTNVIEYDEVGVYESTLGYDDQILTNTLSANYYVSTDSLGSNVFAGFQYAAYRDDFDYDIQQTSTIGGKQQNDFINNGGENDTDVFSAQIDYTKAFNDQYSLELGIKFSRATIQSYTTFSDIDENGIRTRNDALSNNFDYDERVPAAYANFKGSLTPDVKYSLGLRGEYTDYALATSVDGGRLIEDQYVNLFPNASVNASLSEEANGYFTYASRIIRAPYEGLNPFVVYQDAFTSIQGNPNLQPSIVHAIELGGAYREWSLKTAYTYTKDPIDGGAFQSDEDPRVYILQRTNVSREDSYTATLSRNINVGGWRSINNASVSYSTLVDDAQRFEIGQNRPYYYLYSQNSIDVKDWFTLYVTGWYLSNKRDGINDEKDLSSVNVGLEKKLWHDQFIVNLDFNDIFHEVRYDGEYTLGQTDIIYANTMNTNYVRLSLTYNFGKLKEVSYQNKNVGESETQRAQ